MKKIVMVTLVGLFLAGTASTAGAVTLTPGLNAVISGVASLPAYDTVVTSVSNPYTFSYTGMTGTVSETVYQNSTGLLFTYTIKRAADAVNDAVARLSLTGFSAFSVNADYVAGTGIDAIMATRSGNGDTVGFTLAGVTTGTQTDLLWIQTNAQYYTPTIGLLQDGGQAEVGLVGPTATPEPGTVALFSTGLLGLMGFRRKRTV